MFARHSLLPPRPSPGLGATQLRGAHWWLVGLCRCGRVWSSSQAERLQVEVIRPGAFSWPPSPVAALLGAWEQPLKGLSLSGLCGGSIFILKPPGGGLSHS